MKILHPLVKRFIAGYNFDSAKPVIDKLLDQGYEVSIDYLGELSKTKEDCRAAAKQYHKILEFCMSVKSQYFYKKSLNKFFFRETIKNELPKYIFNQRKIGKPGSSHILTYTLLKKKY